MPEIDLPIHSEIRRNQRVNFTFANDETDEPTLARLGFSVSPHALRAMAMDAMEYPAMATTASIGTPVQFSQYWEPDLIKTIFAKQMADELMTTVTAGSWEDAQIVQTIEELIGNAVLYSDYANPSNAQYNLNFQARSILRFQKSVQVGFLQEKRAGQMRYNARAGATKAAHLALDVMRNQAAFTGYVEGTESVHGVLNDPNLLPYGTLAVGNSGDTTFASKTHIEIINDLRKGVQDLATQLNGNFNPQSDKFTIWLPVNCQLALTAVPQYTNGNAPFSVEAFIKTTWPNCEVKFIPQFNEAVGGENVMYIVKDDVMGSDTVKQYVPARLFMVGYERKSTSTIEVYSNATAGVFVRYRIGIVRYIGC